MVIIALTPHPPQAVPLPLKGEGFVPHPTANAATFLSYAAQNYVLPIRGNFQVIHTF